MLALLHVEVGSFDPLDAVMTRTKQELDQASLEEQQAYSTAWERDSRVRQAFFDALWSALRSYFGEYNLPPFDVVEAYMKGDDRPYRDWDLWVGTQINPNQITTLTYNSYFDYCYCEVDHGDHRDLLILRDVGLELFLRHQEAGPHAGREEKLFRPFLLECSQRGLVLSNHRLEVTFVAATGLHTTTLPTFLQQLGLQ